MPPAHLPTAHAQSILTPLSVEGRGRLTSGTVRAFVSHRASGRSRSLPLLLDRGEGWGEEPNSACDRLGL